MASIFPILLVFVVTVSLMTLAALFTPKGPQQVTIRTSLLLALACCYLMWMVTYLAQLHPLISPIHSPAKKA